MNEESMTPRRKRRRRSRRLFRYHICLTTAVFVAMVVVVGAVLFGSVSDKTDGTFSTPTSSSLRLNGTFGPKYAGEIVAMRAAIFERNGIDIELLESGGGDDPIAAVASGAATFGVTDSISFLNARAKGQPIVAFASGRIENSIVFYSLEKSGIRSPQDFIGKRVGRRAGTDSAILYDALLRNTGLSRSQINESATETGLDALLGGNVDVIPGRIGQEGFLLSQMGIPFNIVRIADYGIHVPDTVYFTTEKLIADRPSLVQRFLQAIIAGWTMTYSDTATSVPLIVAVGKNLTSEQVRFELAAQRDFVMPLSRRVAEFDEQQWKQLRAILTNARLMDGSVDLGRAVNYDILKEAYRKPISFGN